MTSTVTVRPSGATFDVEPGETIMAAALRNGFRWPTVCGGQGTCRTCVFKVVEGEDAFCEPNDIEKEAMALLRRGPGSMVRLACQARTDSDVTVNKPGVRRQA